ncbi:MULTISPECIES: hypothetical protein [Burkholderia]|uniref:hypothetical protein n=1 Tax=Burkholderia TaxID=32008 RepID=UPI0004264A7F|nr:MULTISPECIES: hypothetical protein [Burkholderia]
MGKHDQIDIRRGAARDKDEFGSSDFEKEAKKRKKGDLAAARIDQVAKQSEEWARDYNGGATPSH